MIGDRGPAPTRANLIRLRRRLEQVNKGAALLRRKREALVTELFRHARPAVTAREAIDEQAAAAYHALLRALAEHGEAGLVALGWPTREVRIEIEPLTVWGVHAADVIDRPVLSRSIDDRGTPPASTGASAEEATTCFERLTEMLLDAASNELMMRRLGEALARSTRQVHTLEQRVATRLDRHARFVRSTLEEREREEHTRMDRLLAARRRERENGR